MQISKMPLEMRNQCKCKSYSILVEKRIEQRMGTNNKKRKNEERGEEKLFRDDD